MSNCLKRSVFSILFGLFFMCVNVEVSQSSVRHGAQIFVDYCSGCHSLHYLRYSQMAQDLGLNKVFEVQTEISMPPKDASQWFGRVPPDLSLIARQRSSVWLYTFLKSFYADAHRPFGTNNRLVPDINMPNTLEPLQREMSQAAFDNTLNDLVDFLVYVGEPKKQLRIRIGFGVIVFLCIFVVIVYQLKNIYWQKMKR